MKRKLEKLYIVLGIVLVGVATHSESLLLMNVAGYFFGYGWKGTLTDRGDQ